MAVGFIDGSVVIYQGDVRRDRSSKQRILKEGTQPVTGLAFQTVSKETFLYVATTSSIYLYNVTHKDLATKVVLDTVGCVKACSVLAESMQDTHFMIAKDDAVYCYTSDGRGPCYAVEGEKILLQWYRSYLIIVARDTKIVPAQNGKIDKTSEQDKEKHIVTVLDIQNKFIVFSAPMREVQAVMVEWGSLYVLTGDNCLSLLVEKDLQSKLALLFKKNLYDVSIRIAKSHQYDLEGLTDIFRQYGDHLYSKGDHNAAIEQYIKTIGKLEPSYVIRKFLQSHQIDNLTDYLQVLHKQGVATADHTTLLLNCYTKLNKIDKFKEFIMTKDREVDFNVEVAINVCRQTSSEDALVLAEKHKLHSWYLKIQIEDHAKYIAAIEYIGKLPFAQAEDSMKKFGNVLLQNSPKEATDLLKRLCTNYRPYNKSLTDQDLKQNVTNEYDRADPADYIHLFENNSERLVEFLEYLIQTSGKWQPLVYNTLVEHYLQVWSRLSDAATRVQWEQRIVRLLESPDAKYDRHQTLILCQAVNFRPGILYLYEENKLYQQILQYHLSQQDYQSVLACCRRFGLQDPSLWLQALWAGAKDIDMPSHLLAEILTIIEKERLLSPLLVIDALSNWNAVKVGDIRAYLQSVLQAEEKLRDQDQARNTKYKDETARIRKQIHNMQNSAIVFQGSRCCACNHQLELPSVHFLCQHSYHQHCFQSFSESENECPVCLPGNKHYMDLMKLQEQGRDLHEAFHSQLDKAEDGFSLVADYFGRGVFNKLTIVNDPIQGLTVPNVPVNPRKPPSSLPLTYEKAERDKSLGFGASYKASSSKPKATAPQSIPIKPKSESPKTVGSPKPSYQVSRDPGPRLPDPRDSLSEAILSPKAGPAPRKPPTNPFEEDDYPEEKNPFGSDDPS
ncbi:vacuolar protein sorting-associated protein 11 homolog isoform X1 [Macrosteles quadrilineatus]|uniref:vacuolar protein sorting-associated protein 11 homolog isoform X1 n=1 Tax=Macrosteles quadrilineatus TaxID=74068 RepID=UPI0023E09489|nr:vacuolar protein sorting-associated protein 11 homolog isoform X1 [Macrosteles quadrilineatus]